MDDKKKKSVKTILCSLLLIVVGIVYMAIVIERMKTGWYLVYGGRRNRYGGRSATIAILIICVGCFNLYRGLKGKGFQADFSNVFSSHADGSPYTCPHCGAKLEKGQFSCLICGKKVF